MNRTPGSSAVLPVLLALALPLGGCTSREIVSPPSPTAPDSTLLTVRIRLQPPPQERAGVLNGGWFVRLPEGTEPPQGTAMLRASAATGDVLVLANAEPGRYALVAVEEHREGQTRTTWLPLEGVKATITDLQPATRAVLGTLTVVQKARVSLDEAQRNYRAQVRRKAPSEDRFPEWLGTPREFVGIEARLDASESARNALARDARRDLAPYGWELP